LVTVFAAEDAIADTMAAAEEAKMVEQLKLDKRGNVITQPVTGYELFYLAGIGVLLSVDYVDNPRKLITGEARRVQLALTPKRAQQLGESLQRVATASSNLLPMARRGRRLAAPSLWPLS
jgi:hypothetical protein